MARIRTRAHLSIQHPLCKARGFRRNKHRPWNWEASPPPFGPFRLHLFTVILVVSTMKRTITQLSGLHSEKDQLYHNVHVAQKNKEYWSAIACYDRRQTRSPRFVSKRSASAPLDFASSMKNWAPQLIMEEVSLDLGHLSRNTTDLNEKCKNVRRDTGAFRGIISFNGFMSLGSLWAFLTIPIGQALQCLKHMLYHAGSEL